MSGQPKTPSTGTRIACTLLSAGLVARGVWSMATQLYAGHTSKLGGADVLLTGRPAVWGGMMIVSLGLVPLALWARNGKQAAWWASLCMVGFVAFLFAAAFNR